MANEQIPPPLLFEIIAARYGETLGPSPIDEPPLPTSLVVAAPFKPPAGAISLSSSWAGDEPPAPESLVVAPQPRLTATRPIVTWTRTDPEVRPQPLVLAPSTRRSPGAFLTVRSTADTVAVDVPPPPLALIATWRAPAAASMFLLARPSLEVPTDGTRLTVSRSATGEATSTTAGRETSDMQAHAAISTTAVARSTPATTPHVATSTTAPRRST